MRRLLFAIAAWSFQSLAIANPTLLPNFDSLLGALRSGRVVKGVYTYAKCTLRPEDPNTPATPAPNAIGGNTFQTWEYFAPYLMGNPNGFLSTSETVFVSHKRYGYINNYGRTKITDNNTVEILIDYLDPKTFDVKMHEIIDCQISNGHDGHGAAFYAQ